MAKTSGKKADVQLPGGENQGENQPETPINSPVEQTDSAELLRKMQKQIDSLQAQVANANRPTQRLANPEADLPDQDDIEDKANLKHAVLTKQGWLVPPSLGSKPNQNL